MTPWIQEETPGKIFEGILWEEMPWRKFRKGPSKKDVNDTLAGNMDESPKEFLEQYCKENEKLTLEESQKKEIPGKIPGRIMKLSLEKSPGWLYEESLKKSWE